jgi:hypothetical protein
MAEMGGYKKSLSLIGFIPKRLEKGRILNLICDSARWNSALKIILFMQKNEQILRIYIFLSPPHLYPNNN